MTLEDLKKRCKNAGFKYAYGRFSKAVEPPHLVAFEQQSDNFFADNRVYRKDRPIQLDYTYIDKNIDLQNKIEDEILGDISWNKSEEAYLSDEDVWQVSYFFELN